MAHITFIHGIGNKPPADELHGIWRDALRGAVSSATSTMVYWADLLYERPLGEEATGDELEAVAKGPGSTLESVSAPDPYPVANLAWLAGEPGADRMMALMQAIDSEGLFRPAKVETTLESIPLPYSWKKRLMATFLRDVHAYLFNRSIGVGGRPATEIQKEIRRRFTQALTEAPPGPHLVVSHSMGTVIAYDCLKRVDSCPVVDHLITMGSPLGIDEIQHALKPEWSRPAGFPLERVREGWVNAFDSLDIVCGADPRLANDFLHNSEGRVVDTQVQNRGVWRHDAVKYLEQEALRDAVRSALL